MKLRCRMRLDSLQFVDAGKRRAQFSIVNDGSIKEAERFQMRAPDGHLNCVLDNEPAIKGMAVGDLFIVELIPAAPESRE